MAELVFVGEKRSNRAIAMGVTWEDGRLAAKVLHEALTAAGVDPARVRFVNLFRDGEGLYRAVDGALGVVGTGTAARALLFFFYHMGQKSLTRSIYILNSTKINSGGSDDESLLLSDGLLARHAHCCL